VPDRIGEQIPEDLLEPDGIGGDRRRAGGPGAEGDAAGRGGGGVGRDGVGGGGGGVEGLPMEGQAAGAGPGAGVEVVADPYDEKGFLEE
jgi:hypothetical protein